MFRNAHFIACVILCVVMSSCGKVELYDRETQLNFDIDSIQQFITANNLRATNDGTGLFSEILNPGTGVDDIAPEDDVIVDYTGKLLNGIIVEEGDSVKLKYSGLTAAWQNGLTKIKTGGQIRLLIPSTLAYTDKQVGLIPPNSSLDYVIRLRTILKDGIPTDKDPDDNPDPQPDPAGPGVILEPDY